MEKAKLEIVIDKSDRGNRIVGRELRFMNRFYWLFLCLALCSCKKEEILPNQTQGAVDLSSFVYDEIAKYGGPNFPQTNNIGNATTDYIYSEDQDGFQVISFGNRVTVFQKMLQPYFGTPVMVTSNENGLSSFVYGTPGGIAINCSLDSGMVKDTRRELTHFVVLRPGVLK